MPGLQKVLNGILRYRATVRHDLVKQFEAVRNNPNPTAVMFTCMDSRILPTRVTQSNVGDMFVVRNSGNMIPHARNYGASGYEVSVTTEPAALELAVKRGGIHYVIVCGHSDCKAINTLHNLHQCPKQFDSTSPMDHWLRRNGHLSIQRLEESINDDWSKPLVFSGNKASLRFEAMIDPDRQFGIEDRLSQINTLQQLENIASHGFLEEYLDKKSVHLHAMWFDVYTGDMYMFSRRRKRFVIIDESTVAQLLKELGDEGEQ